MITKILILSKFDCDEKWICPKNTNQNYMNYLNYLDYRDRITKINYLRIVDVRLQRCKIFYGDGLLWISTQRSLLFEGFEGFEEIEGTRVMKARFDYNTKKGRQDYAET